MDVVGWSVGGAKYSQLPYHHRLCEMNPPLEGSGPLLRSSHIFSLYDEYEEVT